MFKFYFGQLLKRHMASQEYIIEFVKGIIIYFSKHENYSIQNYTVFHYVDLKWKVFAPDKSFSNTLTKCGV